MDRNSDRPIFETYCGLLHLSRLIVCCAFLLVVGASTGVAQQDSGGVRSNDNGLSRDDPRGPLAFRRLMVPADRVQEEIGGAYLSMSRERFEAIIERLSRTRTVTTRQPALISSSSYYGRLDNDDLVDGRATLRVLRIGAQREWMLEPLNVAIGSPRWLYGELGELPAAIFRSDEGDSVLQVEAPGTLEFNWSLRSEASELASDESDTVFRLALPGSVSNVLWLELPVSRAPHPSHGRIAQVVDVVPRWGERLGISTRLYRIELPRSGVLDLRIVRTQRGENSRTLGRYRATNNYQVAPDSIVFSSDLKLEPSGEWPDELLLDVDEELFVDRVELGDVLLPFEWRTIGRTSESNVDGGGKESASRQLAIQLPPGPVASGDQVTIHALVDFPDREVRALPHWRPQGWEWSEETSRVVGDRQRPFTIQSVASGVIAAVEGGGEETQWVRTIHHYDPASKIEVALLPPHNEMQVEQATVLTAAAGSLTATTHARLMARRGELFELTFEMPLHWQVNTVIGFPLGLSDQSQPSITGPINVVERWQATPLDAMTQQVRVRLSLPVTRRAPVRLVVSSVRVPFPEQFEPLTERDFDLVRFRSAIVIRKCLGLIADAPFRYQLESDARCRRLDRDELPAFFQNLAPQTPFDLLTELDEHAEGLQAVVQIQPMAIVDAEISTDVLVEPGQITETYTFTCDPRSAKIDHLEIQFSESRRDELEWRLESQANDRIRAQRIDTNATSGGSPTPGETWRIDLYVPRESTFRLIAKRVSPLQASMKVSLATARRALPQTCRVSVLATGMIRPQLTPVGMTPRPAPPDDEIQQQRVYGAFGYDPAMMASTSLEINTSSMEHQAPDYWVLHREVESRLVKDRVLYRANCEIDSNGVRRMRVTLPKAAVLGRVTINSGSITTVAVRGAPHTYELQIGEDAPERFQLELSFSAPIQLPRFRGQVALADFSFDGKELESQWNVGVSDKYLLLGPNGLDPDEDNPSLSVLRRLFLPLLDDLWRGTETTQAVRAVSWSDMGASGQASTDATRVDRPVAVLVIYNRSMLALIQLSLMLLSLLVSWRLSQIPKRHAVFLLLVLIIGAVIGPMQMSFWIAPLVCGGSLGLLIRWTSDLMRKPAPASGSEPRRRFVLTSLWLIACAVVAHSASAQSLTPSRAMFQDDRSILVDGAGDEIEYAKVVIPVDENREPVGSLVYLPREFYDRLLRADLKGDSGQRWGQISSIEYRIDGDWTETRNSAQTVEVTARMQIKTSRRNARFVLPFDPTEIALIQGQLTLDGEEPVVEALANERLVVEIPQMGDHLLEVSFVPRFKRTFGVNVVRFAIPQIHRATCRVRTASLSPTFRFPTRRGAVRFDALRGVYDVDLGPANRLELQWETKDIEPFAADAPSIQRLFWMTVSPKSVFVDGTVQIRTATTMTEPAMTLPYRYVPYWRQLFDDQNVEVVTRATPEENGVLKITRPEGANTFNLNFTLIRDSSSGVGQFRFPDVWFGLSDRSDDRYALSAADGMTVQFDDTRSTLPVRVNEFARLWEGSAGTQRTPPSQVRHPAYGESVPAVRSRMNPARTSVAERMSVSVGRESTRIRYRANMAIGQGRIAQMFFATPQDFQVRSVQRIESDRTTELPWLIGADGRLLIQPPQMLSGEVQIEIEGEVETAQHDRLPTLSMVRVESRQVLIEVYREEAMQVSLMKGNEPWRASDDRLVEGSGRRVATINLDNETPEEFYMNVDWRPFDESRAWQVVTAVERRSEGWFADVAITIDFPDTGMPQMDACRLRIRDGWSGPFDVDLDATTRFDQSPDGSDGILVIEPTIPFRGRTTFHVVGPLATPIRVPNIIPVTTAESVQRQVVLPSRLESESLQWDFSGLQPVAPIPDSVADPNATDDGVDRFDVQQGLFEAMIQSVDQVRRQASIELLEQQVVLHADGYFTVLSQVDLLPSGIETVEMELPNQCELLSVSLDGVDVEARSSGADRWNINLPTPQLPSHLLIAYQGRIDESGSEEDHESVLGSPQFPGVTVKRTTWSICMPPKRSWEVHDVDGESEMRLAHRMRRLSAINQIMEDAMNQLLELNDLDRGRWFAKWNDRFVMEARQVERDRAVTRQADQGIGDELNGLLNRHRELADQLGLIEQLEMAWTESLDATSAWQQQVFERSVEGQCQFWISSANRVGLQDPPRSGSSVAPLLRAMVAVMAILGIVLGLSSRVQSWGQSHAVWICIAMLVGCGLMWLNWFTFPWLAYCFMGMAVTLIVRRLDAWRRLRGATSTAL